MELQGYALVKKDANCSYGMGPASIWQGNIVRVVEFNDSSESVLVTSRDGNAMCMFDFKDLKTSFKCQDYFNVLIPVVKGEANKVFEAMKRQQRKGGYDQIVRQMVIQASIHSGE